MVDAVLKLVQECLIKKNYFRQSEEIINKHASAGGKRQVLKRITDL